MSLPSINFLHLTVSEIQPGETFSPHPPAHPDSMGENNTPTALKGCGVIKTVQEKLDLRIGEPMQICIYRKDNSPKPVNHHLTLKEGPKVKSDNIRRFPANDILEVGFTLQTSRINNKRLIRTFKFGCTRLTWKEGPKVKYNHMRRFPAHDFL